MFSCPMCPRQLKSRSGLSGHLQFKHATPFRALEAAPEQPGAATSVALQAASEAMLPEHFAEAMESTVYMINSDVLEVASKIELQEVILWWIDTNVEFLQSDIKSQREEHQRASDLMMQSVSKLIKDVGVLSLYVERLSTKLDRMTAVVNQQAGRHRPGFCGQPSCEANCHTSLTTAFTEAVKFIRTENDLERLGISA